MHLAWLLDRRQPPIEEGEIAGKVRPTHVYTSLFTDRCIRNQIFERPSSPDDGINASAQYAFCL